MNDVSYAARADDLPLADINDFADGLSDELRARVKGELEPGERVLWIARSNPRIEPDGVGFYVAWMISLCLLVLGLLLIMPPRFLRRWNDGSAMILGLLFLGIACLVLFGLFAGRYGRRTERCRLAKTSYAITDRRAIIWSPESNRNAIRVQTLVRPLEKKLVRVESPDGSGDLDFSGMREDFEFSYYHRFVFAHIPEVRRVEHIVRNNLMTSDQI